MENCKNSKEYKAGWAAAEWWQTLSEEQRKQMDIVDAFAYGVLHGWNNPNWIPVEEELPKPNIYKEGKTFPLVLVCLNDGCFEDTDAYDTDNKTWCKYGDEVEYWMPLPAPPQGKEDKK